MEERKNSAARIRANNKYAAKAYDRINIAVPKGRKDEIKALADTRGQSVNAYIISAVDEKMKRDSGGAAAPGAVQQEAGTPPAGRVVYRVPAAGTAGTPQEAAETSPGAGVVSLPLDTLEAAERAAKRTGETVAAFVARAVVDQEKRDDKAFKLGINPA